MVFLMEGFRYEGLQSRNLVEEGLSEIRRENSGSKYAMKRFGSDGDYGESGRGYSESAIKSAPSKPMYI